MQLGGVYAYAGRDWVCSRVARLLGAAIEEEVHNHHNFAWLEEHDGKQLWVYRKGATPAFPGQRGFVGGTMGEQSVILEGVDSAESKTSLYSTVHGAGRVMGRKQAAGVIDRKTGVVNHVFTHFPLELVVYTANVPPRTRAPEGMRWVPVATLADEALPNVMRKVVAHGLA